MPPRVLLPVHTAPGHGVAQPSRSAVDREIVEQVGDFRLGQGDGALVDLPNGQLMLVDAAGGIPDAGAEAMLPLLRARGRP